MNKNKFGEIMLVIGEIVVMLSICIFCIGFYMTHKVSSTTTGYEEAILIEWRNSSTEYQLNKNCKVVVTELEYHTDSDNEMYVRANYNVYNNYGKRIGSGYNPLLTAIE